LLADGVLGVDFGDIGMPGLDGFLQFGALGGFVFAGFCCLPVELFCCELWEMGVSADGCALG
jgi:hypothetical protein